MRRLRSVLLGAGLGALLAAGCERGEPAPAAPSQRIGQGVTLRYWAPSWVDGLSYGQSPSPEMYGKLEEVTGVHIEFQEPLSRTPSEQLKELMNSGTMPDIIEWRWLWAYPGGPGKAIDDGLIVSLGDEIRRYAPNLLQVLLGNPDVARSVSTADGRYYAFPDLQLDPSLRARCGPVFRREWLEKVRMEPPETVDEWYEVLRAFKGTTFGTPGSGAEYPFGVLSYVPWLQENLVLPAFTESNAFAGAFGVANGLFRAGGAVRYGPAEPAYRRMLELLASWYQEGLIHPASLDPAMGRQWVQVLAKCGSTVAYLDDVAYVSAFKFTPAALPRGGKSVPSGTEFVGPSIGDAYAGRQAAAVSTTSAHRTEAVRWLDVAYGAWGSRLFNFGIEGKSYELRRGAPVLTSAVVEELTKAGASSNYGPVASSLFAYSRGVLGGPFVLSAELYRQELESLMPGTSATFLGWGQGAVVAPTEALNDDPAARDQVSRALGPITDYVNRSLLEFVSGRRPLEDFDVYVRRLDELGLAQVLEIVARADAAWKAKRFVLR